MSAKLINKKVQSQKISEYYPFGRIVLFGLALGTLEWLFAVVINQFINSTLMAGEVSTILTATIGVLVLIKLELRQPLAIAVSVAASLWGIPNIINGLPVLETLLWTSLLYSLAYLLFSWIAKYKYPVPMFLSMLVVIVFVRVITKT